MTYDYPFTEEESRIAYEEWGANCGPNSLAFALQVNLESVRQAIPGFEEKHYTSPTMMRAGLLNLGVEFFEVKPNILDGDLTSAMFSQMALVRIQWGGPWTKPGVNPKWAYRQTHWIATWNNGHVSVTFADAPMVFDCNGGINSFRQWEKEIVPAIIANYPRADGKWWPTHVWRIVP